MTFRSASRAWYWMSTLTFGYFVSKSFVVASTAAFWGSVVSPYSIFSVISPTLEHAPSDAVDAPGVAADAPAEVAALGAIDAAVVGAVELCVEGVAVPEQAATT